MKKLLIYDLDGTLVDTREDIVRSVLYMQEEMNVPPMSHEEIQAHVGRGLYPLMSGTLRTNDKKLLEKGGKIYRNYYSRHMLDHSVLYPEARNFLEKYKDRKQAVVTNKPNPFSEEILIHLGVADYFVKIVAGDDEHPKKPDPSAVLSLLEKERIPKENALFIGDSLIDLETARNSGIDIAIISHGFGREDELKSAAPNLLVKDFTHLREEMEKRNW